MRHRNILAMASMLAAVGGTSLNEDYQLHEPAPEPRRRPAFTVGTSAPYPPPTWPKTTAELSKARSMERKWCKAAAMHPGTPAAIAVILQSADIDAEFMSARAHSPA